MVRVRYLLTSVYRWYPSSIRLPDGSLMIVGGIHENTNFYNDIDRAANTVEFFPPKFGGVPRFSEFLKRSLPANLFPRYDFSIQVLR